MDKYINTQYDSKFNSINKLLYTPWVGSNYSNGINTKKILILAESVYDWDEGSTRSKSMLDSNNFTRQVVHEHGLHFTTDQGIENSSTYRNLERAVFGKQSIENNEGEFFWTHVALHQYVQRPMKNYDEKPTQQDFVNGYEVLKEVIKTLQPDLCLMFGTDWKKIKPFTDDMVDDTYEEFDFINRALPKKLQFTIEDSHVELLAIRHPSMYFSWDKWHDLLQKNSLNVV